MSLEWDSARIDEMTVDKVLGVTKGKRGNQYGNGKLINLAFSHSNVQDQAKILRIF